MTPRSPVFTDFDAAAFDVAMANYHRPAVPSLGLKAHWAWPRWADADKTEFAVLNLYTNRVTGAADHVTLAWPLQAQDTCKTWRETHDCVRLTPKDLQCGCDVKTAADLLAFVAADETFLERMITIKHADETHDAAHANRAGKSRKILAY